MSTNHIVSLSGGKDSTALALALKEREPREYQYICTPTGNESPAMEAHWQKLEELLNAPLLRLTNGSLESWMDKQNCLPNSNMRWCTRLLKIVPFVNFIKAHQPAIVYSGLRADEPTREGLYGDEFEYRCPLREWGWGLREVKEYLELRQIVIPERTDCLWCYDQKIVEWYLLLYNHPDKFDEAIAYEDKIGHTFRSKTRDTWPADLRGLKAEFERGRYVRGSNRVLQLPILQIEDDESESKCRICSL